MRGALTLALIACAIAGAGCEYVVVPPEASGQAAVSGKGWTAVPTSVGPTDGGALGIELTIRNETGAWSAMEAGAKPATLTSADGTTSSCATVKVGTGGHRVAPGLQIRGYQTGPREGPGHRADPGRVRRRDGRPGGEARARLRLRDRGVQLLRPRRDAHGGDARGSARSARDGPQLPDR